MNMADIRGHARAAALLRQDFNCYDFQSPRKGVVLTCEEIIRVLPFMSIPE
jgi:hypothetical protein